MTTLEQLQQLHSETLSRAAQARAEGDRKRARKLTRKAQGYQSQISRLPRGYREVRVDVSPGQTLEDVVREARVTGLKATVEEQLQLWATGQITQEEFTRRRIAAEGAHLTWFSGFEKSGVTKAERSEFGAMIRQAKVEETKAVAESILGSFLRGDITASERTGALRQLEAQHLAWAKAGMTTGPWGFKPRVGYIFETRQTLGLEETLKTYHDVRDWEKDMGGLWGQPRQTSLTSWEYTPQPEAIKWLMRARIIEQTKIDNQIWYQLRTPVLDLTPNQLRLLQEAGFSFPEGTLELPTPRGPIMKGFARIKQVSERYHAKGGFPTWEEWQREFEKLTSAQKYSVTIGGGDIPKFRPKTLRQVGARLGYVASEMLLGAPLAVVPPTVVWDPTPPYAPPSYLKEHPPKLKPVTLFDIYDLGYPRPVRTEDVVLRIAGSVITGVALSAAGSAIMKKFIKPGGKLTRLETVEEFRTPKGTVLKPTVKTKTVPAAVREILEGELTLDADTVLGIGQQKGARAPVTRQYGTENLDELLKGKTVDAGLVKGTVRSFKGEKVLGVETARVPGLKDFGQIGRGTFTEAYAAERLGIVDAKMVTGMAEETGWALHKELGYGSPWTDLGTPELTLGGGKIDVLGTVKKLEAVDEALSLIKPSGVHTPFWKTWPTEQMPWPATSEQLKAIEYIKRFAGTPPPSLPAPVTTMATAPIAKIVSVGLSTAPATAAGFLAGVKGMMSAVKTPIDALKDTVKTGPRIRERVKTGLKTDTVPKPVVVPKPVMVLKPVLTPMPAVTLIPAEITASRLFQMQVQAPRQDLMQAQAQRQELELKAPPVSISRTTGRIPPVFLPPIIPPLPRRRKKGRRKGRDWEQMIWGEERHYGVASIRKMLEGV